MKAVKTAQAEMYTIVAENTQSKRAICEILLADDLFL